MSEANQVQALIFGSSIADDLRVLRTVLKPLAEMTETAIDDTIVIVIDRILESPALIALVDGMLNGTATVTVDVEEFRLGDGAKVLQHLPQIIALIKLFRELSNARS